MRLVVFYDHILDPIGGAPVGLHHMLRSLPDDVEATVWARERSEAPPDLGPASLRTYSSAVELHRRLDGWIREDRPELVLMIGFFIAVNPSVAARLRRAGIDYVIAPLGQLADSTLDGRVFSQGCDVGELERRTLNLDGGLDRLKDQASPWLKRSYIATVGRRMLHDAAAVAAMSDVEADEIRATAPRADVVALPWGIDTDTLTSEPEDPASLWRPGEAVRLIVWSRLDWHFKGLDRVLRGTEEVARRIGTSDPPFRVMLCGPDYRGGSVDAQELIDDVGLGDFAEVVSTGGYTPGSKRPLREADGVVLLSRWDGSPRALREAIHFRRPVLVTAATHFADLVTETGAGLVVTEPDEPTAVADDLQRFAEGLRTDAYTDGVERLAERLDWATIGRRFVDDMTRATAGSR